MFGVFKPKENLIYYNKKTFFFNYINKWYFITSSGSYLSWTWLHIKKSKISMITSKLIIRLLYLKPLWNIFYIWKTFLQNYKLSKKKTHNIFTNFAGIISISVFDRNLKMIVWLDRSKLLYYSNFFDYISYVNLHCIWINCYFESILFKQTSKEIYREFSFVCLIKSAEILLL